MSIMHYAMFRIIAEDQREPILSLFQESYSRMATEIPGISNLSVLENCFERESNCDIMVRFEVSDLSYLPVYIEHPLHKAFMKSTEGKVNIVSTIDCLE